MSRSLLLVDDDDTFRGVLAGALAARGYAVQTAADATAAMALARGTRFDDAIVDLRLPGTSGLALIEQLRCLHSGIRIVVLTGYASIAPPWRPSSSARCTTSPSRRTPMKSSPP